MLGTWLSASLFALPKRSAILIQRLLPIFVVVLKPFGYPAVEFFDKGVGFCWRAYRNLGTGFTSSDLVMGSFIDTAGTTTSLITFDERGIMYLAATNAR